MPKQYDANGLVSFQTTGFGSHRGAWLLDAVPNPLNQSGQRLQLNRQGSGVEVQHAGNSSLINFTQDDHIFTRGLFNCFAVCAAWTKVNGVFQSGFLAHVSSPGPLNGAQQTYFHQCIQNIPANAFVACGIGLQRHWGPFVAQTISQQRGVPDANIWIYFRPDNNNQVGFGIDKHGRFGEVF